MKNFKANKKTQINKIQPGNESSEGLVSDSNKRVSMKKVNRYFSGGVKKREVPPTRHSRRQLGKASAVSKIKSSVDTKPTIKNVTAIPKFQQSDSVLPEIRHTLKMENVKACITAMLKFESTKPKSQNRSLFEDEAQPIHMLVQSVRVPVMNSKNYRFILPHPLIQESSEVCLFVPNLKKGKREDHEPTIEYYKDLLEKHEVKSISQIIPLRQVQVEYDQYELRRHLVNQFDMFLADGRITGHIQGLIGKEIYKRRKLPAPVDFRMKDLKKEINTALSKTLMIMSGRGEKASLKVGHTKQSVPQIAENIIAVAEGLAQRFPGGWSNIRSLQIHLQDGILIPIYVSLRNCNSVEVPVVTPTMPKKAIAVEGELSTMPGVDVVVLPDGEVVVKKKKLTKEDREFGLTESDLEDFDSDEEMDADISFEVAEPKSEMKIEPQPDTEENVVDGDDDNSDVSSVAGDEPVEAAENAYLNQWREQWNENVKEDSRKRKEKKTAEDSPQTKKQKIEKNKVIKKSDVKVKTKKTESKNKMVSENVENEYSSAFTEGGVKKGKLKKSKSKRIKNNDLSKVSVSENVENEYSSAFTEGGVKKAKLKKVKSKKIKNLSKSSVCENVENENSSAFTEGGVMKGKLKKVKSKKIRNNDLSKGSVSENIEKEHSSEFSKGGAKKSMPEKMKPKKMVNKYLSREMGAELSKKNLKENNDLVSALISSSKKLKVQGYKQSKSALKSKHLLKPKLKKNKIPT